MYIVRVMCAHVYVYVTRPEKTAGLRKQVLSTSNTPIHIMVHIFHSIPYIKTLMNSLGFSVPCDKICINILCLE